MISSGGAYFISLAEKYVGATFDTGDVGWPLRRRREFVAAGLHAIDCKGISDPGWLITTRDIGIVIEDIQEAGLLPSVARVGPDRYDGMLVSGACRYAAEICFAVGQGAENYRRICWGLFAELDVATRSDCNG